MSSRASPPERAISPIVRRSPRDILTPQQREISAMREHLGASIEEHGLGDEHAPERARRQ